MLSIQISRLVLIVLLRFLRLVWCFSSKRIKNFPTEIIAITNDNTVDVRFAFLNDDPLLINLPMPVISSLPQRHSSNAQADNDHPPSYHDIGVTTRRDDTVQVTMPTTMSVEDIPPPSYHDVISNSQQYDSSQGPPVLNFPQR